MRSDERSVRERDARGERAHEDDAGGPTVLDERRLREDGAEAVSAPDGPAEEREAEDGLREEEEAGQLDSRYGSSQRDQDAP